jgi:cytochrome b
MTDADLIAKKESQRLRVWDLPVRLFHWLLAILILVSFVTGNIGGNWLEWHMYSGFTLLGLVLFRIVWGFVDSYHARFVNFVRGPAAVLSYLRAIIAGTARPSIGHNPMGALSVLALLLSVALQAVTGLFANDDIMLEGPLASAVSKRASDLLTYIHKVNSNLLLALIALHVLAIAYYFFAKKENLLKPMITGVKQVEAETPVVEPEPRTLWLATLIAATVAVAVYFIVKK